MSFEGYRGGMSAEEMGPPKRVSSAWTNKAGIQETIEFLREAASVCTHYHPHAGRPLALWLEATAEQIAISKTLLGLPITYPVHFAEEILNRPAPVKINRNTPYQPREQAFKGPYTERHLQSVAEVFGLSPDEVVEIRLWDGKLKLEVHDFETNDEGVLTHLNNSSQTYYIQNEQ